MRLFLLLYHINTFCFFFLSFYPLSHLATAHSSNTLPRTKTSTADSLIKLFRSFFSILECEASFIVIPTILPKQFNKSINAHFPRYWLQISFSTKYIIINIFVLGNYWQHKHNRMLFFTTCDQERGFDPLKPEN
jgi:hypothetical protein